MTLEIKKGQGISLESYLVGFLHHALCDIADSLADNDSNKAMRKTHEAIRCLKEMLQFRYSVSKEEIQVDDGLIADSTNVL